MGIYSDILLTVDFDRTLTGPDDRVPERNLEAIHYFMDNGGAFTINTGRSLPMAMHNIAGKIPVNAPLLLYTGSADYDPETGKVTRAVTIPLNPAEVLSDIQTCFPALNVEVQGITGHHMLTKNPGWESYCENNHCDWSYITLDAVPQPFVKFAINGEFRCNTVASMYEATPEDIQLFEDVTEYIHSRYGHAVDTFRSAARILDVHAKGTGKFNAAKNLQKKLGRKYLVCVGDAQNDLSMLRGADAAYCPKDADIAHLFETVCSCGEGAVADVILEKIPAFLKNQK